MRHEAYPSTVFKERQTMARLDEIYKDKGEGADRAADLANQIREFPFEIAEREPYLWIHEDSDDYKRLLDRIRPDNMLVMLIAKGVKTDATEKYYGTKYSYTEETGPAYAALLKPPTVAAIHLPKPDPFVPSHAEVLAAQPVRLIDEPALSLFYSQDTEFLRPMVTQVYRFRLPRSRGTLENAVLLRFYEACVNESLNEIAYPARMAGLNFSLTAEVEGVNLAISGYNESASRLLDTIAGSLVEFQLAPERFAAVKDRIVRDLRNFPRADAWQIGLQTRRAVVREFYFRPDVQLPVAEKITLDGVKKFASELYKQGKIEALIHGNVSAAEAMAAARRVGSTLQPKPGAQNDLLRRRLLTQKPGSDLLTSEQLEVNNSAFRRDYVLGGDTPEMRAAALTLTNFIADPFFGEMRTHQQLGYIVFGGAGEEERTTYAYFIIQSGDHPADEVEARADAFIGKLPGMLAALPDDAWETIREGVRSQLEEKDKTIAERAARLFTLAYDYDGDWGRREETLAALDKLTKERAQQILAAALAPETRQMRTFLGFARDHKPASEIKPTFSDAQSWKKTQTYR
jgi:secreted Zn-dependent insulinase-like peptidase